MKRIALIAAIAGGLVAGPAGADDHTTPADPYIVLGSELSNSRMQARFEVGLTKWGLDAYVYHESDPLNGIHATWNREVENGIGIRYRWEFPGFFD